MNRLSSALKQKRPIVIGMIHLDALPGTPLNKINIDEISEKAAREANVYAELGIDGLIVENMADIPYVQSSSTYPETVSFMTRCAIDVKRAIENLRTEAVLGINLLASRNKEAISVAAACGYDFIRCEGFVFAHIADEGFTDACAGELLRYRKSIGAEGVAILADIKKKHSSHSITADVSLEETCRAAKFFLANGVVVTGKATGEPADAEAVKSLKRNFRDIPVFVGSGVTDANVNDFMDADGLIIGSYFKRDGYWANELDALRISSFMDAYNMASGKAR